MSWDCPHLSKDYYCNRLGIKCDPSCKGCVLNGKVIPLTKPTADTTKTVTNDLKGTHREGAKSAKF